MYSIKKIDVAILALLVTISAVIFSKAVPSYRFHRDEVDYMSAAIKGFPANYLDRPSISFNTFLRQGFEKGMSDSNRSSLSEFIRNSDDISFYRHYHGPFYFYWLEIFWNSIGSNEYRMRWTSVICHLLSIVAMYFGCFLVLGKDARVAAVLSSSFLAFSPSNTETATLIAPHSMYVLAAIVTLFLIANMIRMNNLRYWNWLLVTLCIAFLSIEYALLLLVTLLLCLVLKRKAFFTGWAKRDILKLIITSAMVFLAAMIIMWPGGVYKLTIVKDYIFFLYYASIRSQSYGMQSVTGLWWHRVADSPVEYSLIISCAVFFVYTLFRYKKNQWLLPFLVYAGLWLVTSIRNASPLPAYISSFMPPMYVISAVILAEMVNLKKLQARAYLTVILCLALLINCSFYFLSGKFHTTSGYSSNELVEYFANDSLRNKTILASWKLAPIVKFYYPDMRLNTYVDDISTDSILDKALTGAFDGILYRGVEPLKLQQLLEKRFQVEANVIAKQRGIENEIVYYRVRPLSHYSIVASGK